ncbi:MAG: HD domain-containing protein [Thermoguttaceae bacterium]|nr:HD domain-containing protein [Thermoguttaceae bacterium]
MHRSQRRKDGSPYLSHLLRVAGRALEYGASEDVAIAALLHDAVEDCGGLATAAQIRALFGEAVERLVLEESDSVVSTPEAKAPWRERKEAWLARLETASPDAALIAGCDKLDNATSLASALLAGDCGILAKFKGGSDGIVWYFRSIVEILARRGCPCANDLADAVERLAGLIKRIIE